MAVVTPTGVTETDNTIGSVTLSFTDQSSGAAWHRVYRRTKSVGGNTWVRAGETDEKSDTTIQDQSPGLSDGVVYEYAVTAFDADEESGFSSIVEVTAAAANTQPATPTLTVSNIGDTVATLSGSAFSDPDGDSHGESQWQVTTDADTGFASPVVDTTTSTDLEEYLATGLTASTDYRARVRYKDDSGDGSTEWSEWSDAETFSTTAEPITGTAAIVSIGGTAILVGEAT